MKERFYNSICIFLFSILIFLSYKVFFSMFFTESKSESTFSFIPRSSSEDTIGGFIGKKIYINKPLYKKEVFLTFDDGPSPNNTPKILKILNEKKVKATFFIIGRSAEEFPNIIKNLNDSGMCIAAHTYCHDYKKMYASLDNYFNDLDCCNDVIEKLTGKKSLPYVRLPGGSDNLVCKESVLNSIRHVLNERDMYYIDWNVSSGDGASNKLSVQTIKNNIVNQCKNKRVAVILMHDGYYKKSTMEALPFVIDYLKKEGFTFRTFADLTLKEREHLISHEVINRGIIEE